MSESEHEVARSKESPAPTCGGGANSEADERLMRSLPKGHVIRVLMEEHVLISATLDRLEILGRRLAGAEEDRDVVLGEIRAIGAKLVASEPHHQREERVLFPRLFDRGLIGPPTVMNEEHVEIRLLKHSIESDAQQAIGHPEADCGSLQESCRSLVGILRAHIIKENNILYPMALGLIQEDEVWAEMQVESEALGACFVGLD